MADLNNNPVALIKYFEHKLVVHQGSIKLKEKVDV